MLGFCLHFMKTFRIFHLFIVFETMYFLAPNFLTFVDVILLLLVITTENNIKIE